MNKLDISLFCLFLLCFVDIKAQENKIKDIDIFSKAIKLTNAKEKQSSCHTDTILSLDYNLKKFEIIETSGCHDYLSSIILMQGTFVKNKNKNKIVCNSVIPKTNRYTLDIIDQDKLLNKTLPFFTTDTLYITIKFKDGNRQFIGSWKNGKKEGRWAFFKDGKYDHTKIYKAGMVIEEKKIKEG